MEKNIFFYFLLHDLYSPLEENKVNKDLMNCQRKVLGVLGFLLAPCCFLFGLLGNNLPDWYASISATYYANSKMCMIGLLFSVAVFFYIYHGYENIDVIFSVIQATASLTIIAFPCATTGIAGKVGLFGLDVSISHSIHCVGAAVLFVTFGTNIMFLFTKGDSGTEGKKKRNIVYYVTASIIYACCLFQVIINFCPRLSSLPGITMINECMMLWAFSFAWLTKSGTFKFLND